MTFTDLYPSPDPHPEEVTAQGVAGHYAAHALYLMGRAYRRRELHGPDDSTYLHLLSLAASEAETAYTLHAASTSTSAEEIAHMLLLGWEAGEAHPERAAEIAQRAGHDPAQARRAGYES